MRFISISPFHILRPLATRLLLTLPIIREFFETAMGNPDIEILSEIKATGKGRGVKLCCLRTKLDW